MIQVTDLCKSYNGHKAIEKLSFSVEKGKIYGFLGPNGAGKSTTMNIIAGCLAPNSGEVLIGGRDIQEESVEARRLIGYLPEQPPLYPDMTVDEYLGFVYELRSCDLPREAHLAEVCKVTRISDVRSRVIGNLSKGYRQRVGIAQALVGNPPVIIFDEPTVGLDPKQIIEIRNLIRNLGKNHTVILSTHILSEVQAVCDRIIIIKDGEIVADEKTENISKTIDDSRRFTVKISGPQKEVTRILSDISGIAKVEATGERELDSYTYVIESEKGVDPRKPLFYAMAKAGYPILGLETSAAALEDVFISLTSK